MGRVIWSRIFRILSQKAEFFLLIVSDAQVPEDKIRQMANTKAVDRDPQQLC
jgi:hypothetical protein